MAPAGPYLVDRLTEPDGDGYSHNFPLSVTHLRLFRIVHIFLNSLRPLFLRLTPPGFPLFTPVLLAIPSLFVFSRRASEPSRPDLSPPRPLELPLVRIFASNPVRPSRAPRTSGRAFSFLCDCRFYFLSFVFIRCPTLGSARAVAAAQRRSK